MSKGDSTCTQVGVEAFLLQHDEQRAPSQQHSGKEQVLDDRRHGHPPPSPVCRGQARRHAGERQPPRNRIYLLNETQIISTPVVVAVEKSETGLKKGDGCEQVK